MSCSDEELWAELNRIYAVEEKPADAAAYPEWAETERLHTEMRRQNRQRILASEDMELILRENCPVENPEKMSLVRGSAQ